MNPITLSPITRNGKGPIHLEVRERILDLIKSGQVGPGERIPAETEIAEMFQVSRMTVNKAILSLSAAGWVERQKGKGTFVSELSKSTALQVGVVIVEDLAGAIDNYYFGSLYFGLIQHGEKSGISFNAVTMGQVLGSKIEANQYDGFVFVNPPSHALHQIALLGMTTRDAVVLGSSWPGSGFSCIDSDNIYGSALAVSHLADLNHTNIMFVGACPQDANSLDRLRGFEMCAKLREIKDFHVAPWSPTAIDLSLEAEEFVREILQGENPPTAIIAGGAMIAMQISRIATELNISVPGELSIVGYDDPSFLNAASVPITTLSQPFSEMVELACRELMRLREDPLAEPEIHICQPELILRSSTGSSPTL